MVGFARSGLRLWLAVVCAATGCGDDGGQNGGGNGQTRLRTSINLSQVIGFAITDSPSMRLAPGTGIETATCNPSTLYAVEASGALVVTTVTETTTDNDIDAGTECNTSMTTERARNVIDTPKYVVIGYFPFQIGGGDAGMTTCGGVILRKSDGALFCIPESPVDVKADASGDSLLVASSDQNGGGSLLTRLNMAAMPPTATSIVDAAQMIRFPLFDGNSDGDALVPFSMVGPPSALRIYKVNGGLQNVTAQGEECQWTQGHDFFVAYHDMSPTNPLDVYQLARQSDGSFMSTKVGSMTSPPFCRVALITPTQTYAYNWGGGGAPNNELVELIGGSSGTGHVVPGVTKIVDAIGVGNSVFVQGTDASGNGIIVREDVPAFTATTLLPAGEFSLTAISVSKTGELTFAGLRNSDGTRVVGNVAAGASTYTILSSTAPMVTDLQRIN